MTTAVDEIPVLLLRDELVAVAKPPGLTVVPSREDPQGATLRTRMEAQLGQRLWVVHRLDRDTSGVVLLARTAEAHRLLSQAFTSRAVRKTYLAVCHRARPEAATVGRVDLPLRAGRRGRMRIAPGDTTAQAAVTRYRVVGLAGELALVEAHPETGRTHQIRVHLAAAGWPLAIDPLYGEAGPLHVGGARCDRLTLHARRLVVPPVALDVTAPLPGDLGGLAGAILGRDPEAAGG